MPRLLQLSHGYPPHQAAGTEQYAARLAMGLRGRGWEVLTIAAHQAPGLPMYQLLREPGLLRVVQNLPFRGLGTAERDEAMDAIIEAEITRFRPDVIHIQHLQSLSWGFRTRLPKVWTLHDAWGWCAAGGQLLSGGKPCLGPAPDRCAPCAGQWAQTPVITGAAVALAGRLSPIVAPDRLHRLWKQIPAGLRSRIPSQKQEISAVQVARRLQALREFAQGCTVLSPSQFLADLAIQQGFGAVRVLPHGVASGAWGSEKRSYLLFLGTMAPHKHPLLVRRAWQRAGRPVPLRLVGPAGPDAGYMAQLFAGDPQPEGAVGDVRAVLAGARALVLGSVWPENAPLVILEARAAGCPVIAPRIGGIPEMVPEDAGLLYAPGDEGALAEAMLAVLGRSWEPPPPLSFEAHLDRLLAVYAGVLSKGVEAG